MSHRLTHLHSGDGVSQAILGEDDRLVLMRFGHNFDETCKQMDDALAYVADIINDFALIYAVDMNEVPDFNEIYDLRDPSCVMFFYRKKQIKIDLGTGDKNRINWVLKDDLDLIDIVEAVYRGAKKGRDLVTAGKNFSTEKEEAHRQANDPYNLAIKLYNSNDLTGAIEACKSALKLDGAHLDARRLLHSLFIKIGDPVSVLRDITGLVCDPDVDTDNAMVDIVLVCMRDCTTAISEKRWEEVFLCANTAMDAGADLCTTLYMAKAEASMNLSRFREALHYIVSAPTLFRDGKTEFCGMDSSTYVSHICSKFRTMLKAHMDTTDDELYEAEIQKLHLGNHQVPQAWVDSITHEQLSLTFVNQLLQWSDEAMSRCSFFTSQPASVKAIFTCLLDKVSIYLTNGIEREAAALRVLGTSEEALKSAMVSMERFDTTVDIIDQYFEKISPKLDMSSALSSQALAAYKELRDEIKKTQMKKLTVVATMADNSSIKNSEEDSDEQPEQEGRSEGDSLPLCSFEHEILNLEFWPCHLMQCTSCGNVRKSITM